MKKIIISSLLLVISAYAADSFESWFEEGTVKGNVRYYFIETKKDKPNGEHTSAHSNAVGGQLSYTTASWDGFQTGATFMTTNGFALPNEVDTSTIGRDNGVRESTGPGSDKAQDSFSILGEAFLKYSYKDFSALYGRKVIKTPLIHAKDVRMLPSAVQGAFVDYKVNDKVSIGSSYLTHFKQRTSDEFTNIVEHALGERTRLITGDDEGEIFVINADYKGEMASVKFYNYYAQDFLNSLYLQADFKNKLDTGWTVHAAYQYIYQKSIGDADDNLHRVGSVTGGNKISSNAFGFKFDGGYDESNFNVGVSKVLSNNDRHDSLVLPWDGTPLFTNTLTSNVLFQSNYGKGLVSDTGYIGGSLGTRFGYSQGYDFLGVKGFKTNFLYLIIDNDKFANKERDFNAIVSYTSGGFSLAFKGIWSRYNSSADEQGNVTQNDKLTQYRVIANFKF